MSTIRYIIVVHGIGEQRKNETVLSVVNRFAEIRAKPSPKKTYEILTLGKATGQTGKDYYLDPCRLERNSSSFIPWMEFKQIPQLPKPTTGPFYGEKPDNEENGENLRFVDLCWADIMQQDYPHVGQKVDDWAKGLVGRLQHKANFFEKLSKPARILFKNIKEDSSNIDEIKDEMTKLIQENDLFSQFIQLLDDDLENKISNAKNADELKEAWQEVKKTLDQTSGSAVENYPLLNFGPVPKWVLKILKQLAETLIFVRRLLSFRVKKVEDMVYNQFLGDVQLYGEFPRTRGRAVRRFHKLMWRIHTKHWELEKEREEEAQLEEKEYEKATPEYTILAHSLGTVMSMDALLYALVDMDIRIEKEKIDKHPELPFPGYWIYKKEMDEIEIIENFIATEEPKEKSEEDEKKLSAAKRKLEYLLDDLKGKVEFLNTEWIKNVDSFITLGSPIDKFLVLWWLNYSYLNSPNWKSGWSRSGEKIKHFNYTDEQDPVGHALDKFRETEAFKGIFENGEDRVFNRYVLPGVAHVKYWKDLELFQHIAHFSVDEQKTDPPPKEPEWFKLSAYCQALLLTYFAVPIILTILITFTFTWALITDDGHGKLLGLSVLIALFILGRRLIDLILWWRKVMREKAGKHFTSRQENQKSEKAEKLDKEKVLAQRKENNDLTPEELKDLEDNINSLTQDIKKIDKELEEYPERTKATNKAIWTINLCPLIFGVLTICFYFKWPFPNFFNWISLPYPVALKINILLFLATGTLVFSYVVYRYHQIKKFFKSNKINSQ